MYNEDRNPFFRVLREPLKTAGGIDTGKDSLVNPETGDVLGIVGRKYELVHNHEVNGIFTEALETFGVEIEDSIDHMDATTKRWRRWLILGDGAPEVNVGNPDDKTKLMVQISNGYTGKTSFGYNMMGFRGYCHNGQIFGRKDLFSLSLPHFVDNPEKLHPSFENQFGNFQLIADTWNEWATRPFSKQDFENFMKPLTKERGEKKPGAFVPERVGKKLIDEYDNIVVDQKLNSTMFGAYNVLTWAATHETKARKGSNVFSSGYGHFDKLVDHFYNLHTKKEVVTT